MRLLPLIALILLSFSSCKSAKLAKNNNATISVSTKSKTSSKTKLPIASIVVNNAETFIGTKYKFSGTTKKGMDCSGLIYVSFQKEDIALPRISRDMAKQGQRVTLQDTKKGDLLFFKTSKNRKVINHVGLVVNYKKGIIEFIHSTTSKGVIISSLSEHYWKNAFVEARRVL